VLAAAATEPAALLVAGASPVVAAVLGSWYPLLLGMVVYLALVVRNALRPAFWSYVLEAAPEPAALPDPNHVFDPTLRSMVAAIANGRAEVKRLLAETPTTVRGHLGFAPAHVDQLERCAARLIVRADGLSKHIKAVRRESVFAHITRLERLVQQSEDELVEREYRRARELREDQLRALDDLVHTYERLTAILHRIVATIEALPPRLLRVRTCAEASEELFDEVNDNLERMGAELCASERIFVGGAPLLTHGISDETVP